MYQKYDRNAINIQAIIKNYNVEQITMNNGDNFLRRILPDDKRLGDARVLLINNLMKKIDEAENQKASGRISSTEMENVLSSVKKEFLAQHNAGRSMYHLGTLHTQNGRTVKVIGHDFDGEPLLTTDLSHAVQLPTDEDIGN